MESQKINKDFVSNSANGLNEIRESQIEYEYVMPTDYSYILLNFGKIVFTDIMRVEFNSSFYDFGEFYDLALIEWQLKHTRKEKEILNHTFWLEDYLCIGQMTAKHILIGVSSNNANKIFLFDNEETQIDYKASDIFTFINEDISKFIV